MWLSFGCAPDIQKRQHKRDFDKDRRQDAAVGMTGYKLKTPKGGERQAGHDQTGDQS